MAAPVGSYVFGVLSILVLVHATLTFAYRSYTTGSHVKIVAFVGALLSLIATTTATVARLAPFPYLYCETRIVRILYLAVGSFSSHVLLLHYVLKSRVLNTRDHQWNYLQRFGLTIALLGPWAAVFGGFSLGIKPYNDGTGMCSFVVPEWVTISQSILTFITNSTPPSLFVLPLIRAWVGLTHEKCSKFQVFLHALRGKVSDSPKMHIMSFTSVAETIDTERTTKQVLPDVSERAKLATAVRWVFFAALSSFVTTFILLILLMAEVGGAAYFNSFYSLDSATGWFWAAVAHPLPHHLPKEHIHRVLKTGRGPQRMPSVTVPSIYTNMTQQSTFSYHAPGPSVVTMFPEAQPQQTQGYVQQYPPQTYQPQQGQDQKV